MSNRSGNKLRQYLKLGKLNIMVPVSITGFTGYFIRDPRITPAILLVTAGILLMAVSASILNQVQETATDRKMKRTHDRPLPSGNISPGLALVSFAFTFSAGSFFIYSYGNWDALIVSLITLIWYNGVYTYLKRFTAFAVIPGSLTGALPPLIGWVAAGGSFFDTNIILVQLLLFTGQIPHFWLFLLKYGEEYTEAGLPSLTAVMNTRQICRLIFAWVIASAVAAVLLFVLGVIRDKLVISLLLVSTIFVVWQFMGISAIRRPGNNINRYSIILNSWFLMIMILLITDRI